MLRFITNNPKITLEVGCREATHSLLLKKTFSLQETWGIEPENNKEMVSQAKKNLDYFINDYLTSDTKDLPSDHFDLIIFNDVLEHMYDPWEVLISTKKYLKDDGIIVISIPNIRHKSILKQLIFHDDFQYKEEGLLDITHIRFFTKKTIIKMLEECGYEILKIDSIVVEKKQKIRKRIFNFLTNDRFKTIDIFQYGITAKKVS